MKHIIRRVLPTEYHKYKEHLRKLDAASRHLRFTSNVSDQYIDAFCDSLNPETDVLFCVEDFDLNFIGVGHISVISPFELALSVLPQYQKQGIGSTLMERMINYCRAHDINTGFVVFCQSNAPIHKLCKRHGISIEMNYGEVTGSLSLDSPTIKDYLNEMTEQVFDLADFTIKRLPWKLIELPDGFTKGKLIRNQTSPDIHDPNPALK